MNDKIHEECGVFGIYSKEVSDVASPTYYALYALQHRGQESCGIVVNDSGVFTYHKDNGLVPEVFTKDVLAKLGTGNIAVGHVRYGTADRNTRSNAQPLVVRHIKGPMAIAFNGALTNAGELRDEFELKGGIFHTANDAEIIAYTITEQRLTAPSIEVAVEKAMRKLKGAFSVVLSSAQKLIAFRDPVGFRPLCLGTAKDGSYIVASESCAFDAINGKFVRDIAPGEIVVIDDSGVRSITTNCTQAGHPCVFEYVYFARPDSIIDGVSVHRARLRAGEALWNEYPVEADVVVGVPDSGLDAALGLSRASGIPYGVGFIKNRYVGRTFIQPVQGQREDSVRIKLNVVADTVRDKRVILVDDSIVRGTTSGIIVKLLREAGAKEIHMRISSPPFVAPCYFGTDIDGKDKLIACKMTLDEIKEHIGVDSLGYLTLDGIKTITKEAKCDFCYGCFTEQYPCEPPKCKREDKFSKKIK